MSFRQKKLCSFSTRNKLRNPVKASSSEGLLVRKILSQGELVRTVSIMHKHQVAINSGFETSLIYYEERSERKDESF